MATDLWNLKMQEMQMMLSEKWTEEPLMEQEL